ncbi:MAG: cellulose biosynthesis cyclic di-GMP-binding regulatory protein BcsB [Chloroflexota bacterium]
MIIRSRELFFIIITLAILSLFTTLPTTQAQDTTPVDTAQTAVILDNNIVTFAQVNFAGQTLRGPSDSARLFLSLPADWQLQSGSQVQLDLLTFISEGPVATSAGVYGGSLEVEFNDIVIGDIQLAENGPRTVTFDIPDVALVSNRIDGRFPLEITVRGDHVCDIERNTNVVLLPSSQFILPHTTVAPSTDLTQLPRPIYQRSFLPDEALLVVPEQPSAGEMQAAMTVAAGFGKMANSSLQLALTPLNQLTTQLRSSQNLIFVGTADAFSTVTPLTIDAPPAIGEADGDGLIRMAVSPWNNSKVVLIVSGSNEAATIKAAQAISTGTIRTGGQRDVAIVEDVDTITPELGSPDTDRTFEELGYELRLLEGRGTDQLEIEFFVPDGQTVVPEEEAVINLIYNHSALLDYARSGISVILNDDLFGSVRLTEESTNLGAYQARIPISALRPGRNILTLRAELVPERSCNDLGDGAWLSIRPESWLHLPLTQASSPEKENFTLSKYPDPFALDTTLSSTAIVVPQNDVQAWNIATQIAFDLGNRTNGTLTNLRVAYGDNVPAELRDDHDMLIIGQASTLPILAELNNALPAPFADGANRVADEKLPVEFLIPPDVSLGYLELLRAPWNQDRAILAILGDSALGLEQAITALTTSSQRTQLATDFAVVEAERLFVAPPTVTDEPEAVEEAVETAVTETSVITSTNPVTATEAITTTLNEGTAVVETTTVLPTEPAETAVAAVPTDAPATEEPQFSVDEQLAESGPILTAESAEAPPNDLLFSRWVWITIIAISIIILLVLVLIRFRQ